MTSLQLFYIADTLNISTYFYRLTNKKAFSSSNIVVLDPAKLETDRDFKKYYSEELGHCLTDGFYPLAHCAEPLKRSNIEKAEGKALCVSYLLQVPLTELKSAVGSGASDYEIAEALDVDLATLSGAVKYYRSKGLL